MRMMEKRKRRWMTLLQETGLRYVFADNARAQGV